MSKQTLIWMLLLQVAITGSMHAAVYPISYHLVKTGQVSVNVYDANGVLVRELLHAVPQPAGDHTVVWDGLDRTGKGMPAGKYSWKLLQTPGLKAQFQLLVGANYPMGTNLSSSSGPGTHNAPYTVAIDATGIYFAALQTENIESGLIKLSLDGQQRLWSQQLPFDGKGNGIAWEGARSIAVDNGEVYQLGHVEPQRVLITKTMDGTGAKREIDVRWDSIGPDYRTDGRSTQDGCTHGASDMDICSGVLVVAYQAQNAIRWYNPATGALIDTATVPAPGGVTVGKDGIVYVSSGSKVVRLTQADHSPVDVVSTGLAAPGRLDVDHANGSLLVYDAGTLQIKRISAAGALLNTYGAAGGRQDGLYVDTDFAGFSDLCADGAGGFFVAESYAAPRRIAHFNNEGKVIQEWYGGQPWAPHAAFEPGNPNAMWMVSAWTQKMDARYIMRMLVDFEKKSWRVHSVYKYYSPANPLMHDSGNESSLFHVYQHNGTRYLAVEGSPCIQKIDETNWKLLPIMALTAKGQWHDENGDGLPQDNEYTPFTGTIPRTFHVPHLDADFTYYFIDNSKSPFTVKRFPVTGWTAAGAPIYGSLPDGEVVGECPPRFTSAPHSDARWGAFLYHDTTSGNLFAALNPWTNDWCTSADSFLQQWDAKGRRTWAVGELAPAAMDPGFYYHPTDPGQIYRNLRGIAGVAHGCVIGIDVDGGWTSERAQTYVWDQDGLFVGGIMDHPDLNGIPEFMYHCGGEFCHATVYTLPNGDVYFAGNWENDMRIYKVTGWKDWIRKSGTLAVTNPTPDGTGQGLTAEYFNKKDFADRRTVCVDGTIDLTWPNRTPIYSRNGTNTKLSSSSAFSVRWRGAIRPQYGPQYTGFWTRSANAKAADGGLHAAKDNNARVECKFRGTSISIVGLKSTNCGYANIYLDGEQVVTNYDCYSAKEEYHATYFEKTGLADGDHTVTLEAVGGLYKPHNPASGGYYVYVDKFVVNGNIDIDDDGLTYTFYTVTNGGAQLWLNPTGGYGTDTCIIYDWPMKDAPTERASAPLKLLRRDTRIQLSYFKESKDKAAIALKWSSTLDPKGPIPATVLFPLATVNPVPELHIGCAFLGPDTATQGNWKGVYGAEGYNIIGDKAGIPSYVSYAVSGSNFGQWGWEAKDDVRALQQVEGPGRAAPAWYSIAPKDMLFNLNFTDDKWHQFSVYMLDKDKQGLKAQFDVLDVTGQLLDSRTLDSYANGVYMRWNLRGHVTVRITPIGGTQYAFLRGYFFDPVKDAALLPK